MIGIPGDEFIGGLDRLVWIAVGLMAEQNADFDSACQFVLRIACSEILVDSESLSGFAFRKMPGGQLHRGHRGCGRSLILLRDCQQGLRRIGGGQGPGRILLFLLLAVAIEYNA